MPPKPLHPPTPPSWLPEPEGQLSVDVIEGKNTVWIRSAIAGIKGEDLDISITTDTVTIRGKRSHSQKDMKQATIHVQECHWGAFSRSIVLPCPIRAEKVKATMKQGILTITLPKAEIASRLAVIELE